MIDFGLNKKIEEASSYGTRKLTSTTAYGTSGYAPPEQYGKQVQVGTYTDVYALGATLYSLLTGEVPAEAIDRLQGVVLAPPHHINPEVSVKVSKAVMAAMELQANHRPQTMEEFINILTILPSSIAPHTQPVTSIPVTPILALQPASIPPVVPTASSSSVSVKTSGATKAPGSNLLTAPWMWLLCGSLILSAVLLNPLPLIIGLLAVFWGLVSRTRKQRQIP